MNKKLLILPLVVLIFLILACNGSADPTLNKNPQQIAVVPIGEPAFPNLGKYWIADTRNWVTEDTRKDADAVLEKARAQGFAETAIVLISGVNNTLDYTTQLGRYLALGEPDGPNKDNGLLWVIYVDKGELRYTAGDGLNSMTAIDLTRIKSSVEPIIKSGDYNLAVTKLANLSVEKFHSEMDTPVAPSSKPETEAGKSDGKSKLTPEQREQLITALIIIFVVWTVFCIIIGIATGDAETAFEIWFFAFRVILIFLGGGLGGGGRSGSGGGNMSGRSG